MASPEQPNANPGDATMMLDLPNELLAVIFLRLPTLEDVGRTATACPTFRHVIADSSFRRRLRSVQRAPFLGAVDGKFFPAATNHPSAPYARALIRASDFSFRFIPFPGRWFVRDARDGRALLEHGEVSRKLAVADPVCRRSVLLPPIPDDLGAPALQQRHLQFEAVLVPAREEDDETAFKVICVVTCSAHLVAFVYSSGNGKWSAFPFEDWSAATANVTLKTIWPWFTLYWRYCANGCFYWRVPRMKGLLVLDTRSMEFSFTNDPLNIRTFPHIEYCSAIAEAGDGRAEMFALKRDIEGDSYSLYSIKRNDAGSANGWQSRKKVLGFPQGYDFQISGATRRYLLLKGTRDWTRVYDKRLIRIRYFVLDLETMQLEKGCWLDKKLVHLNVYTGFPPSLSLPSV